jgi:ParB-like chromosome segregation protein Spo0J
MDGPSTTEACVLERFSTSLRRARCVRPALVERMVASLSQHGQLTPVVGVVRGEHVELVDGFKRLEAARQLGLKTLVVSVSAFDDVGQWVAMLMLNRGPQSMTELEEALVIRELLSARTQVEIGQLVRRHKSWVCRRVGLVERLHPELVESMRVGVLHPGVARRLLGLPPGNQLQVAAAAQKGRLGPRDTEHLVRLWRRAPNAQVRAELLAHPTESVRAGFPEHAPVAADPRLSAAGRQLSRALQQVRVFASRALRLMPPTQEDAAVLGQSLTQTERSACLLASALGRQKRDGSDEGSGASVGEKSS